MLSTLKPIDLESQQVYNAHACPTLSALEKSHIFTYSNSLHSPATLKVGQVIIP